MESLFAELKNQSRLRRLRLRRLEFVREQFFLGARPDLIAGNGPHRRLLRQRAFDGDRDFGVFEGRIATSGGQITIEGTWKFSVGTGKLKGLTEPYARLLGSC